MSLGCIGRHMKLPSTQKSGPDFQFLITVRNAYLFSVLKNSMRKKGLFETKNITILKASTYLGLNHAAESL